MVEYAYKTHTKCDKYLRRDMKFIGILCVINRHRKINIFK